MSLSKQVKDLYDKTLKTLKKEIEDIRRWKDLPYSWMSRNNIQMAILPKAVFRFILIPIRILRHFFTDLERTIFQLCMDTHKNRG